MKTETLISLAALGLTFWWMMNQKQQGFPSSGTTFVK